MKKIILPILFLLLFLLIVVGYIGTTPIKVKEKDIDAINVYYRDQRIVFTSESKEYYEILDIINNTDYHFDSIQLMGSKGTMFTVKCLKAGRTIKRYFYNNDTMQIDNRIYQSSADISFFKELFE